MSSSVLELAVALRTALRDVAPEQMGGAECAALAEELARCEKACGAARILAAARAVACSSHRQHGSYDGPSWLARQVGTTSVEGRRMLATAAALENCAATRAALLDGEISLLQAHEIVGALSDVRRAAAQGMEDELVAAARDGDLASVRDAARARRQAALPVATLHVRQHRARYLRTWRDGLGMVCIRGALPPETGIPLANRLETLAQRARRANHKDGTRPEPFAAHLADALVELGRRDATDRRGSQAELVIVCDLFAWRRGHAHAGEPCHLIDGGPIPVDVAKALATDAFVKAVVHDGVAIHTVRHFGRHLPATLRTALDLGPVPQFSGARCVDCSKRYGLEWDHVDPVANHGPTSYDNLAARCFGCHGLKTERDRKAGRLGRNPPSRSSPPARPARRSPLRR